MNENVFYRSPQQSNKEAPKALEDFSSPAVFLISSRPVLSQQAPASLAAWLYRFVASAGRGEIGSMEAAPVSITPGSGIPCQQPAPIPEPTSRSEDH